MITSKDDEILFFTQNGWMGIPKADALNLACWILALADPEMKEAGPLLKAILNT